MEQKHLRKVLCRFNCLRFLQLLVEELLWSEVHLLAAEVLDSESHSSKLDGVELLYLVVELAFWVLERSNY